MLPPSGSRRSPMTLSKKPRDNNHQSHYPGTARLPGRTLGSHFASPLHPLQHQSANLSLSRLEIVSLASRSKGTLFGQLNMRHAFNMTRGTSNDRSLTDTDGITLVQNPIRLRPVFAYPLTLGYLSRFTITANHSQVFTYSSQVTGNHPTSTGLSMAKQFTRYWPNKVTIIRWPR
jgi:hypothetical protein